MNILKTICSVIKNIFLETKRWRITQEPNLEYEDGMIIESGVGYHVYENIYYGDWRTPSVFKWSERTIGTCGRPYPFTTAEEAEKWINEQEHNNRVIESVINKSKTVKYI